MNQFNIQMPDIQSQFNKGINDYNAMETAKKEREFLQKGLQQDDAIQKAFEISNELGIRVAQGLGAIDTRTGQIDQKRLNDSANFAFSIQSLPEAQQNQAIRQRINDMIAKGEPVVNLEGLLEMPYSERGEALKMVQIGAMNPKDRANLLMGVGKYGSRSANMQNREAMFAKLRDPNTSEEERKAIMIELKLKPSADALLRSNKPVKMSSTSEKALNDAQEKYTSSGEAARSMELLANDVSKRDISGGLMSTWSETFKDLLGSKDEVSSLRRRFRSIRNSQAVNNLPKGPASDKDIALALSGFPGENANAKQIISFLTGQAKLARIQEEYYNFKSNYISENNSIKGFVKAWRKRLNDPKVITKIINAGGNDQLKQAQTIEVDY